jgi:hypothetical protein
MPEQQSSLTAQTSPTWMQKDAVSWHLPFWHSVEQHSEPDEQLLPAVLQPGLRGTQVWLQLPPQHS